jgi:hypothetical protein
MAQTSLRTRVRLCREWSEDVRAVAARMLRRPEPVIADHDDAGVIAALAGRLVPELDELERACRRRPDGSQMMLRLA